MNTTRLITSLCTIGLALSVGACSADSATTEPTPTATRVKSTPLPQVPNLGAKPAGIAKDVKITECPTAKGNQVAKGTVTNSAKEARDLSIIVIWLKNNSGDPLGSGIAVLKQVAPGKSEHFEIKANVVEQADRCVLNAQAGQITAAPKTSSPASSGTGTATAKPTATATEAARTASPTG